MGKKPKYHIGEVLREVRENKGIAITTISEALHKHKSSISRYETGQVAIMDLDLITDWSQVLGSKEPLKTTCQLCPVFAALYQNRKSKLVH